MRRPVVPAPVVAVLVVTACGVSGCSVDPPLPEAPPPDPPAACVLDTAALTSATDVTWTPDESTANDTRCVYDAGSPDGASSAAPAAGGPQFLTVSLFPRTQTDAAAEREVLAQLCLPKSRAEVNAADGGFVCRFDGDLVYGVLVRGDQVVQVSTSAIPATTASATLAAAISDQLAALPT